jgi:hypothetical protein
VYRIKGEGMVSQPVRIALLLGAITAVTVSPARADNCAPACCQPATRTIQVKECVPETYKVKRTVYRTECKTEVVDGFKCEKVPEVRERTVCCVKKVPVMKVETRKCCKTVTDCEERTVMKTCYKNVQETCMKKELVRKGHWECQTVACQPKKCCDPCNPCGTSCCPETKTVKKWVNCPEYRECPVTVCKKVCYQEAVKVKVPVCRQVWTEEKVNVCTFECREEKRVEKYTVCVERKVPCKITRTVKVCVPHEEEVTCTRMVTRIVCKEVPANNCSTSCNSGCSTSCNDSCTPERHGLFHHHRETKSNDCGCCR